VLVHTQAQVVLVPHLDTLQLVEEVHHNMQVAHLEMVLAVVLVLYVLHVVHLVAVVAEPLEVVVLLLVVLLTVTVVVVLTGNHLELLMVLVDVE
jgi:hypothetical protein